MTINDYINLLKYGAMAGIANLPLILMVLIKVRRIDHNQQERIKHEQYRH